MMRDLECPSGILLDHEDGRSCLADLLNDLEDEADTLRRQADGGLVQHHEPWFQQQSHGNSQNLGLPAAQIAGEGVLPLGENRELLHEGLDVPGHPGILSGEGAHLKVLHDGHKRENGPSLWNVTDPPLDDLKGLFAVDPLSLERDLTASKAKDTVYGSENRGLACAVGADHTRDPGGEDVHGDPLEDLHILVA